MHRLARHNHNPHHGQQAIRHNAPIEDRPATAVRHHTLRGVPLHTDAPPKVGYTLIFMLPPPTSLRPLACAAMPCLCAWPLLVRLPPFMLPLRGTALWMRFFLPRREQPPSHGQFLQRAGRRAGKHSYGLAKRAT